MKLGRDKTSANMFGPALLAHARAKLGCTIVVVRVDSRSSPSATYRAGGGRLEILVPAETYGDRANTQNHVSVSRQTHRSVHCQQAQGGACCPVSGLALVDRHHSAPRSRSGEPEARFLMRGPTTLLSPTASFPVSTVPARLPAAAKQAKLPFQDSVQQSVANLFLINHTSVSS